MNDFNYGDIIEYIDETYDEHFELARSWASANNTTFGELIERREEREVDEPYIDDDGNEQIRKVKKLFRYFQIGPAYIPTKEDQQQNRAKAYAEEVDYLHAERQKNMVLGIWTDEDEQQYRQEVIDRVTAIKERYPYPEESEEQ